jgi:CubicO group peptidase (beta-lactamase class C family)
LGFKSNMDDKPRSLIVKRVAMDESPMDLHDGWSVSSPERQGLDASILRGIATQFDAWQQANVHAVLIARGGYLVYERYFTGEDWAWATPLGRVTYNATMKHDIRSITKSVVSLIVGVVRARGWLQDLEAPVFSFFPEYTDLRTPEKEAITVRHLLTMATGIAWNEEVPYSNPENSERQMLEAADPLRYVLAQPMVRPPGQVYNYNGGATALLATIVATVSGDTIEAMTSRELFQPLGIDDVDWMRYATGMANAASGLRLRPRDLAKIGQLMLGRGAWHSRQVVPASWVAESLTPQINGAGLYFYGFQWWLGRSLVERREVTWAAGVGWGGQRLFIVPSLDLVVVVMAGLYDHPALQPIVGEVVLRRYALASAMAAPAEH